MIAALRRNANKVMPVSALSAVSSLVAAPAHAANSIGTTATGWTSQMQSIGTFLVEAGFMGGIGTTMFGLYTLKKASEPQSQQTYKSAAAQIGVGGGLASLPAITGVSVGGIFNGGTGTAAQIQSETFTG